MNLNFTITDVHKSTRYCFLQDECNGKGGGSEIVTCLLDYLTNLPSTVNMLQYVWILTAVRTPIKLILKICMPQTKLKIYKLLMSSTCNPIIHSQKLIPSMSQLKEAEEIKKCYNTRIGSANFHSSKRTLAICSENAGPQRLFWFQKISR